MTSWTPTDLRKAVAAGDVFVWSKRIDPPRVRNAFSASPFSAKTFSTMSSLSPRSYSTLTDVSVSPNAFAS